ncbi:unnamed protein product [Adineta steineri]|uniref:PNPLA domain-containing protein n=1 Tax=Adineta steineri TaxID=433720 RepID=A0A819XWS3_9BILA|nr:unnamed protein product [Adineta steineri]CAF4141551.1 unnamed protein product [Adineta steineri]
MTIGKENWDIAVEYKAARKQEWKKLKRLTHDIVVRFTDQELEYHQHHYAVQAYEQYRAAARELEASESSSIVKKIELRKYMALSLYLAGPKQRLEAQIYVIAGIHLAVMSHHMAFCKDSLEELGLLLRKIHGADTLSCVPSISIDLVLKKDESALGNALTAYNQGSISLRELEVTISSELRMTILNRYSLRTEERKIAISEESTLQVRKKGVEFMVKAAAGTGFGFVTATGVVTKAIADLSSGATLGTLFGGPLGTVIGIGIGLTSLVGGTLLGYISLKKSSPYLKEPEIRRALNTIIEDVFNHYKSERYSEALHCLSTPYDNNKTLLSIRDIETGSIYKVLLDIQPPSIVDTLSDHDFPPEGIAYFLALLGEILLVAPQLKPKKAVPANMTLELPDYAYFNQLAIKIFEEIWTNQSLTERASNIDAQIKSKISLAKKIYIEKVVTKTLAYAYSVSKDYIEERLVTPVSVRLDELKNIAQINYAIAQIISGGKENLKKSVNTIKDIKKKLSKESDDRKMFIMTEIRLQALGDLLAAFGYPDDVSVNRDGSFYGRTTFPELEGPILLRTIDKVIFDNQQVSYCESIVLLDDDDSDKFMLLDSILGGILRLNKNKFVDDVSDAYSKGKLITWMNDIMKQKNLIAIDDWKASFMEEKHTFPYQYLKILSTIYNLIFKPCVIKYTQSHGYVFSPTNDIVNFSKNESTATVYVLIENSNSTLQNDWVVKGAFMSDSIPLNYINNQIEFARDPHLKADLFNKIGLYHQRQAEKADKSHHLTALPKWSNAMSFYTDSLKLDKSNLGARFGFAKCLIKLSKYKQAETFLTTEVKEKGCDNFLNTAERWFLLGVVKRKLGKFGEALHSINEALKLKENFVEAQNEYKVISKLREEPILKRIEVHERMNIIHRESARKDYNILSIDGGGIRGLIPAVWVSELERRTGLTSCSMFHMIAGTSTGAIIAAGLACPSENKTVGPRYTAMDIVKLYTTRSNRVFSDKASIITSLASGYKYTDNGRKKLFDDYFENIRLSQTLTELVITAVQSGSSRTDIFRRSESLLDHNKNHKLADILMCTSAAPTYFPPYNLNGTVFVDGGVQANNPAMVAYVEACSNGVHGDNISVLSLGTGDYVPDPLHPNANRNLLFWLKNKESVLKVIFDGPQNNIDYQLHHMLGSEKYHRWQVWLEEPIALDDIKEETLNQLMELAREHFEEMEALDNNNRLGNLIERLKGKTI